MLIKNLDFSCKKKSSYEYSFNFIYFSSQSFPPKKNCYTQTFCDPRAFTGRVWEQCHSQKCPFVDYIDNELLYAVNQTLRDEDLVYVHEMTCTPEGNPLHRNRSPLHYLKAPRTELPKDVTYTVIRFHDPR